ncbi:hypothetical protein [Acinetobacter sp.]|uniref:hypothetical protein n=1 Tax=Acinetobacter sp. TaxID=472 RepID=UPI0028A6B56A|nr:hypothetical protein [Acinetobacter sp.]
MVAKTDIKFYVHTNNNAPQLQNAYGSMINVLDACLVDGIHIGSISSLTASGKTVTATFSSAHNLMQYQVIKITGATQAEFNGEHRILTIPDSSSLTFELAAAPSVLTATGAISASLPPLGWEKPFSSSNPNGGGKAAYRSLSLLLPSRPFLRVVDELDPAYTATYAKYAKVGIVEDMTDIDTMLGVQAPFDAANSNKNWVGIGSGTAAINGWARWYYAHGQHVITSSVDSGAPASGNRNWMFVGTKDNFFFMPAPLISSADALLYGFGSFESLIDLDQSNTFLSATVNSVSVATAFAKSTFTPLSSVSNNALLSDCLLLQRKYSQEGVSNTSAISTIYTGSTVMYSGSSNYIAATSLIPTVPQSDIFIRESGNILRGRVPLVSFLFQNKPYSNNQIFSKDNDAYIAKDIGAFNAYGQIVIKIGDL